jgi:hypothetical protein
MCSRANIGCPHRRSSNRWCRRSRTNLLLTILISGYFFWRIHSNSIHRSPPPKTNVLRISRRCKRNRLCCGTPCRRCIHRTRLMAVVVLPPSIFTSDGLVSISIFPSALLRLLLLLYYCLFLGNLLHRYLSARNSRRLISLGHFSCCRSSATMLG